MRHLSSQPFSLWMVESQRAEAQYEAPGRGSWRKSLEESSKKSFEKIRIQPTLGNAIFSIWSQKSRRSLLSGAS